jgi:hypothetical protein
MNFFRTLPRLAALILPQVAMAAAPFVWPALPTPEKLARATAMKSDTGLVIVDRTTTLGLRSYNVPEPGASREEVIRFLVVTEEGVQNARIEVNGDTDAKVTVLEGRTVAPDGTVTMVDEKRDIKRVDVSSLKKKDPIASLASVAFPAPQKGAILDLHFVTRTSQPMFAYSESLIFGRHAVLETNVKATMEGGFSDVPWLAMSVGDSRGVVRFEIADTAGIKVHVDPYSPPRSEPFEPPSHHNNPTLIVFMDFSSMRVKSSDTAVVMRTSSDVNRRGRLGSISFPSASNREFWVKYLQESAEASRKFMDHDGKAEDLDVATVAPATMPLQTRVSALYRLAQQHLTYNPDAGEVTSLSALMKKGFADTDHGTLLLAYLLGRAKIPYKLGLVANRYDIRFTPLFRNELLFGFERIILVEPPGQQAMFMMPGYIDLPLGCLPEAFQESLVLLPKDDADVAYVFTPVDAGGLDTIKITYDLELDRGGDVTGKVNLDEAGAPALSFAWWSRGREYRRANPTKADKKASQAELRERDAADESALRDELVWPGTLLQVEKPSQRTVLSTPGQPVALQCEVTGKGLAQAAQGTWLVYANPVIAGMTSRFQEERRLNPIWSSRAGRVVMDGELRLPPGATVTEVPNGANLVGPDSIGATATVEKAERDGRAIIHARLEYDRPLVVGTDAYPQYRAFIASIAKLAQDRCLITMPAQKELE